MHFPDDIISDKKFYSITSFGIFYFDRNNEIDMLYSIPDYLVPQSVKDNNRSPSTNLTFLGCNLSSPKTRKSDFLSTCSIDEYVSQLLNSLIGVPIKNDRNLSKYVGSILKRKYDEKQNSEIFNDIFANLDFDITTGSQSIEELETMHLLIINTNGFYPPPYPSISITTSSISAYRFSICMSISSTLIFSSSIASSNLAISSGLVTDL